MPKALLQGLVAYFDPRKIILFGSRARGEPGPDSDRDLLVVLDDEAPPDKVMLRAGYEAARGYPLAADVIPCRRVLPDELLPAPRPTTAVAPRVHATLSVPVPSRLAATLATTGS